MKNKRLWFHAMNRSISQPRLRPYIRGEVELSSVTSIQSGPTFWVFPYNKLHCLIYILGLSGSSGPWARILRVQYLRPYINPVNTKQSYKYNIPIGHTHVSSPRDFIRFIESGKISNSKLFFIIYVESMTQLF